MKAIVCNEFGSVDKLRYGDLTKPDIAADEVLIKVKFCGINFPDTLITEGKYQFKPDLPFSPGGEVSGEIEKIGNQVVGVKAGERVVAAMGWGGFAEYVVAKATNTFIIPPEVSMDSASALLETYATTIYALKDRGSLKPGETLLVLGAAGGTGTAAIQLGNLFGATVIAAASTEEKRSFCKKNGAHTVIDSSGDIKKQVKELGGADVVFDPVGGDIAESAFRALKPGGRHLVVGFASGKIPALPFNLPLLKSASIVGVFWGHFWRNEPEDNARNVKLLLRWLVEGKITPMISKKYPLSEAAKALKEITERKVIGKVILEV